MSLRVSIRNDVIDVSLLVDGLLVLAMLAWSKFDQKFVVQNLKHVYVVEKLCRIDSFRIF